MIGGVRLEGAGGVYGGLKPMFRRGFTLTEMLIVVLILGALVGIAVPVIRSGIDSANRAGCLSNLRQIGIGLEGYTQDHAQRMPVLEAGRRSRSEDVPVMETVLLDYVGGEEVFRCPADSEQWRISGSSYLWNPLLSGRPKTSLSFFGTEEPSRIPLVSDKEAWHPQANEGTNFLYADLSATNEVRFQVSP